MVSKVIYPQPEQPVLMDFVVHTNRLAQIDISPSEVMMTFQRQQIHPAAQGQFAGIQTVFEHAGKVTMPVRHAIECSNALNSDKNLQWLRTLHQRVMMPIARNGELIPGLMDVISESNCGNYRIRNDWIGVDRKCPKPASIKPLMFWWHKSLGDFHLKWLPKLGRPMKVSEAEVLSKEAYQKHIQLVCIHPWQDGNGRVGRLIENMLRLRWGLPWKSVKYSKRMEHINDIMSYEDSDEWQQILKKHDAKW